MVNPKIQTLGHWWNKRLLITEKGILFRAGLKI